MVGRCRPPPTPTLPHRLPLLHCLEQGKLNVLGGRVAGIRKRLWFCVWGVGRKWPLFVHIVPPDPTTQHVERSCCIKSCGYRRLRVQEVRLSLSVLARGSRTRCAPPVDRQHCTLVLKVEAPAARFSASLYN